VTGLFSRAKDEFARRVEQNAYPGRGLIVGRTSAGDWIQVYWIMGRSEGSRNRVFVADREVLRTTPWDGGAGVGDASLTLYEAMLELPGVYLVSNGDQTRTLADAIAAGDRFEAALETREREHDAPNYTPRISAMLDLRGATPSTAISILKAHPADPAETDRFTYRTTAAPLGLGQGITTYVGDGNPLPPFEGEPAWLPLEGSPQEILERYWAALDADNRVSLAVKRIPEGSPGTGSSEILVRNCHR
jgi:IMP cyclohydrolase